MPVRQNYSVTIQHQLRFGLGSYDKTVTGPAYRASRKGNYDVGEKIRKWRTDWYYEGGKPFDDGRSNNK